MIRKSVFALPGGILALCFIFPLLAASGTGEVFRENFDAVKVGSIPEGWRVDETRGRGKPAEWRVVSEGAGSPRAHVLHVFPRKNASGGTFNLCWTDTVSFLDGEIKVLLKAGGGSEDQGGGPMWRVRDGRNYYVARYNPLENNFRLYKVSAGMRTMLKGASGISIPAGQWFSIRIIQKGRKIQCFLDGKKYIETEDDTFLSSGGVGLWSKADAATSFDALSVEAAGR